MKPYRRLAATLIALTLVALTAVLPGRDDRGKVAGLAFAPPVSVTPLPAATPDPLGAGRVLRE